MDNKQKIAQIDGDTARYQISDHLGSATFELDENADVISYEEYYPFGSTSYRTGRSTAEVSQKRYKYVMKELDNETGLYYYGARYYASWIGRFISVDPLQHKYPYYTPFQYAGNKPITFIDLDGAEEYPGANYIAGLSPGFSIDFDKLLSLFKSEPETILKPVRGSDIDIRIREPIRDKKYHKAPIPPVIGDEFFHSYNEVWDCWRASNLTMIDAGVGYLREPTDLELAAYKDPSILNDTFIQGYSETKFVEVDGKLMYMDDEFYWDYSIQTYLDRGENNLDPVTNKPRNKKAYPEEGFNKINESLEAGFPVMVGVTYDENYSRNPGTDGTTNHFVVIVGRGIDDNGNLYFSFFENASDISSGGIGGLEYHRFYVNPDYTLQTKNGYIVSQVLKHPAGKGINVQK